MCLVQHALVRTRLRMAMQLEQAPMERALNYEAIQLILDRPLEPDKLGTTQHVLTHVIQDATGLLALRFCLCIWPAVIAA